MKKIFSALLLMVICASSVFAQRLGGSYALRRLDSYENYYGFRIGYNAASLRFSESDAIDPSSISAMNFGYVAGYGLGDTDLIFEPGVYYTIKGGKTKSKAKVRTQVFMHDIEVPFVLKYNIELPSATGFALQPFFGGFLNMGMSGKTKVEFGNAMTLDRQKVKTFTSKRFHRLDAGLRMGCGMAIDFFYIEAAYDLGLVDLGRNTDTFQSLFPGAYDGGWDDKIRTGCMSINVGVNF